MLECLKKHQTTANWSLPSPYKASKFARLVGKMRKRDKATQSIGKIVLSAAKMFGKVGYTKTSMGDVARDAGVPESEVQFHFRTKERLLIEAQRSAFRELHRRFVERANRGEKGLPSALDALDSMWLSIRELQVGAPLLVETLSLATQTGPLREKILRNTLLGVFAEISFHTNSTPNIVGKGFRSMATIE